MCLFEGCGRKFETQEQLDAHNERAALSCRLALLCTPTWPQAPHHRHPGKHVSHYYLRCVRSRPGKPNQRKGQNEKFMNFALFFRILVFFLRKTSTIHIELLFRNARSWRPSKEVPKPRSGKVPKKCFGKCRSETGCRVKCRKSAPGPVSYTTSTYRRGVGALFSALSSAPRFGPALSEALFRHFS